MGKTTLRELYHIVLINHEKLSTFKRKVDDIKTNNRNKRQGLRIPSGQRFIPLHASSAPVRSGCHLKTLKNHIKDCTASTSMKRSTFDHLNYLDI